MSYSGDGFFSTEKEYKDYYIKNYCNACPIYTYDNLPVMFYPEAFEHAFYKRTEKKWTAKKDKFSKTRGERLDWIKYVLQDPNTKPKKVMIKQGTHMIILEE